LTVKIVNARVLFRSQDVSPAELDVTEFALTSDMIHSEGKVRKGI